MKTQLQMEMYYVIEYTPTCRVKGPGLINELGSWITYQLIQAYHQYSVDSRPTL